MGVTLRDGDREYFYQALDRYFSGLKKKYIYTYGNAYDLASPDNEKLMDMFRKRCAENGIIYDPNECFRYLYELPDKYVQMFLNLT